MDTNENTTTPPDRTSRRTIIKAGTAAGIVAVALPNAAAAVSVDEAGAFVSTGGFNAPASVTATPSGSVSRAIDVSWGAVTGATQYQVKYRVNGTTDPYTVAGETESTTLQVSDLTNGTTYQFVVVATNGTNTSFDSAPATATATQLAPGVPVNVSAVAGDTTLTVSWSLPTSGGAVSTYQVRRSTDQSTWTTVTGISSNTFEYEFTGLTNGTLYYVQVRAINANEGAWSASATGTPEAIVPAQVPTPPAPQPPVVGATTTTNSVTIVTDSNDGANGAPTWAYSYSTDGGSNWTSAGVTSSVTSFTVTGITASSQTIQVRKVNGATTATSTVTLTRKTPTFTTGLVSSLVNPNSIYGVRGVTVTAVGGSGNKGGDDGNAGGNGGKGGRVVGTFTLDSNETLFIAVGSGGGAGARGSNIGGGNGGTNPLTGYAGGRGGNSGRSGTSGSGGGGGAATVLRKGTTGSVTSATATTILVAGGGGGGGGADNTAGNGGGAYRGSFVSVGVTNGNGGGTPPGSNDDGGGGGGGGGGDRGGLGGTSQYVSQSGVFTKTYYYKGNGGSAGSNSVNGVTTTFDNENTGTLVNGAAGSVALDYLEVSWASVPPV